MGHSGSWGNDLAADAGRMVLVVFRRQGQSIIAINEELAGAPDERRSDVRPSPKLAAARENGASFVGRCNGCAYGW
jgi:hypothetical protein